MTPVVLITGAAGRIGSVLRQHWRDLNLRLLDQVAPADPDPARETVFVGSVSDLELCQRAATGVDAIIHLAGITDQSADWPTLINGNVVATQTLLDAATHAQIPRIIVASSVHVTGAHNDPRQWPLPGATPPDPCCPYGITKACIEGLALRYSDRVPGAKVTILRLALTTFAPRWTQEARAWLSDADLASLMRSALSSRENGGIHYGASLCPEPRYDVSSAQRDCGWAPTVTPDVAGLPTVRHQYPDNCCLWPKESA